jgi:oligoendopeptidase F
MIRGVFLSALLIVAAALSARRAGVHTPTDGVGLTPAASQQPTAGDLDVDQYVWDLSSLYRDHAAWDAERAYILQELEAIGHVRETGRQNAKALANEMDAIADLRSRGAKMAIYGFLVSSVDSSGMARTQHDIGTALQAQAESAIAFLPDDVLAIGEARIKQWMQEEPRIAKHRIRILRILREAPHALSADQLAIVTSMARWPQVSADVWSALNEADLGWTKMKNVEGHDVPVTLDAVLQMQGKDQASAYEVLLRKLQSLQDVYGLLYTRRIEADLTIARQRKFKDGVDAIWYLRDGMPEGSHRIMVDVARANLPTLQRYAKLRNRSLGLDRISYADLNLPPPEISHRFLIAEAVKTALAASAPLGASYQERLRERMHAGWMHLPPWPSKAQSYGIYPPVGGSSPYFVMSYTSDYLSSRAFVGGVTLMMTDADMPPEYTAETWDDPDIYGNAPIYVGNMLHDDYLAAHAANRWERIAYLVNALDLYWAQYFQWTLQAELDEKVQALIIDGKTPTGAQISQIYLQLLHDYFGQSPDVVDNVYAAEWMTHRVPFASYEHLAWPPAIAAAARIMEGLRAGDENARKAVDEIWGRSDYDRTYQMLQQVGIDMAKPEPYQALIRRMNRQLDELEYLLDQKGLNALQLRR